MIRSLSALLLVIGGACLTSAQAEPKPSAEAKPDKPATQLAAESQPKTEKATDAKGTGRGGKKKRFGASRKERDEQRVKP